MKKRETTSLFIRHEANMHVNLRSLNDTTLKNEGINKKIDEVIDGERGECSSIYAREAEAHAEKPVQRYADDGWGKLAFVETTCTRAISGKREEVVSSTTPEEPLVQNTTVEELFLLTTKLFLFRIHLVPTSRKLGRTPSVLSNHLFTTLYIPYDLRMRPSV
ncbi:hypothetical protein MAR_017012 [Mya arenaria]|uniref:Uncharacterized protein n=1 Tax=Mya arenaria TaxID=6604 RepID=A0ABY7EF58_MYAAR|nr:hypothetical protein MAR_017012 [Mya arenaria]